MFKKPKPQFILTIGDDGVFFAPYLIAATPEPFFAANEDKTATALIATTLSNHQKIPVTLLADTLGQDFHRETIPRLNFLDRTKIIQRRIKQTFHDNNLAAALRLPGNQILLAGIHEDGPIRTWLEKLKAFTPRINLLPLEGTDILRRLLPDAQKGWALLLTRNETGGFRQIVTLKGDLIFSRLTPPLPLEAAGEEIAAIIVRDIKASLGYLARHGLTDETDLHMVMLLPDEIHEDIWMSDLPTEVITLLSPTKAAKHLRLPFIPYANSPYADLIFAGHVATKSKPRLLLQPSEIKATKQNTLIRECGTRAAVISLVIALGSTAFQASSLLLTMFQSHRENTALAKLQTELAEKQSAAAPVTEPLGRLRQAVERRRIFKTPAPTPWPTLVSLNKNLGPEARLTKLHWQNDSDKPTDEFIQAEVQLSNTHDFSDRAQTVARFQNIEKTLANTMPGYDIKITRYPFPAMPQETVSNSTDRSVTTAELTIKRLNR